MLHRSVTEMRRLRRGRPKRSRIEWAGGRTGGRAAGRIDPDLGPIGAELLLPHGQAALHFLDDVATSLERLRPMRRGGDDSEAPPAPRPPPQPGPPGAARAPPPPA